MSPDQQQDGLEDRPSHFERLQSTIKVVFHDAVITIGVVIVIGLVLFVASGAWPPLVAVESGSMEPHLEKGDLVFVSDPGRFAPDDTVRETGVIPAETGHEINYRSLGGHGSVIVYSLPGSTGSPIIHRAYFWVEEGENWFDKANPDYLRAENCRELRHCPAPHAGFVTKGDDNLRYDQTTGVPPVRPDWIEGTAHARVPYLGRLKLRLDFVAPVLPAASVDAWTSLLSASRFERSQR